ncbi:MAG TPA: GWxTD domain-containing protein [Terriglobia bacterium]|nr:GWxTD domain-containing protein [Terriglobia bacterium]
MVSFILEAAFRSLALGILVWIALRIFRVRNPHTQSLVWRGMLCISLSMPLLMPILERMKRTTPSIPLDWIPVSSPLSALEPLIAMPFSVAPSSLQLQLGPMVLLAGYVVIALALLLRVIIGLMISRRVCEGALPLTERWTSGHDVRVSNALRVPVTFGSTILLPADWENWSAFERESVLLHESCHVRHRDFFVYLIAGIHRAIFWFNPLAWWLQKHLVELAESIGDDSALRDAEDRFSYAEILLKFSVRGCKPGLAAMAMARGNTVGRRVERILRETAVASPASWVRRSLIIFTFIPAAAFAAGTWFAELQVMEPVVLQFEFAPQQAATVQQEIPTQRSPEPAPAGGQRQDSPVRERSFLQNWPEEMVPFIVTMEERNAFRSLSTDVERERFIEQFWQRRDPTPDTPANEFRDEYYRRIVLGNEKFTSRTGVPGWSSDRGRILIQLGYPDEVESQPAGATLLNPGTGVPFERWRYKSVEGIGTNVIFTFVDPTGEGLYRLEPPGTDVFRVPAPVR